MSRLFLDNCLNKSHRYAVEILSESEIGLTPGVLKKKIVQKTGISGNVAKQVIRELIDKGEFVYTYVFGSNYVELSFLRPVQVTEHFTLSPWITTGSGKETDMEIIIDPGISFGSGRHPTTRLCLEALEYIFFKKRLLNQDRILKAADIGTGSGVLAIAVERAGIADCFAIDTDPNAIAEAKRNIKLNRLEKEINVTDSKIGNSEKFSLICANLRVPTLKKLLSLLYDITYKDSLLVLSGVRIWETDDFLRSCLNQGFTCIRREDKKNGQESSSIGQQPETL